MLSRIFAVVIAVSLISPALAQIATNEDKDRQWVTDRLRLSLYTDANASSQVIRYLSSGDLLEIEQISGAYAFVTTPDGTKGWVKRGFLVSEPTSNLLLAEEQEKTQQLANEIEKLGNSKIVIDQYEKDMDVLVEKIEALEQEKQQATGEIANLQGEIDDLQGEINTRDEEAKLRMENAGPASVVLWETFLTYWEIIVLIFVGIVLVCFFITKAIVETRIRNRFHGIKIW